MPASTATNPAQACGTLPTVRADALEIPRPVSHHRDDRIEITPEPA